MEYTKSDFDQYITEKIAPHADELLQKQQKRSKISSLLSLMVLILIGWSGYINYTHEYLVGIGGWIAFIVLAMLFLGAAQIPSASSRASINHLVVPYIVAFFPELTYAEHTNASPSLPLQLMNNFHLANSYEGKLNRYLSCSVKAYIKGRSLGFIFDMYLVKMSTERVGTSTGHQGLLIRMDTNKHFEGRAILGSHWTDLAVMKDLEQVKELKLGNHESYYILGDEPAASSCFDSDFMEALGNFRTAMHEKLSSSGIECAFVNKQFLFYSDLKNELLTLKINPEKPLSVDNMWHIVGELERVINLAKQVYQN